MTWQRASRCTGGNCVEVRIDGDVVLVRDSKHPERELRFTMSEWQAFTEGAKAGEFDDL